MDHVWASSQLRIFVMKIDELIGLLSRDVVERTQASSPNATPERIADELISLEPVMQYLMNAARPGYGDYRKNNNPSLATQYEIPYWKLGAKPWALRAIGIHDLGAEARRRMRPDSPDLVAEQFHRWVWEAAAPLWHAGSRQEAVHAAARSVNARLQQKRGHRDKSDAPLCREFFSLDTPAPGRPRLRFPGYSPTSATRRSRQQGAMDFGAGCFEGIRNPAAHEHELHLPEQVALEQLAAFSLLAGWIDECEVESA